MGGRGYLGSNHDGDLGSSDGLGLGFGLSFAFSSFLLMWGVDCDLDSNCSAANILALESSNSLVLLFLAADVNEAVALALSGLSPSPADNAGRNDVDSSVSEESAETSIVNVEAEVRDEQHGLGGLACWVFTGGAGCTGCFGLADAGGLLGCVGSCSLSECDWGSRSVSFSLGLLGFALWAELVVLLVR